MASAPIYNANIGDPNGVIPINMFGRMWPEYCPARQAAFAACTMTSVAAGYLSATIDATNCLSVEHKPASIDGAGGVSISNLGTTDMNQIILTQQPVSLTGIKQHFETIYQDHASDNPSIDGFTCRHLYFITAHFDLHKSLTAPRSSEIQLAEIGDPNWEQLLKSNFARKRTQLSEFGKLHFQISKHLLGNKIHRDRPLQPLTYAFTDFEGSRTGKSNPLQSQMPHIHALMLVRPEQLTKFQQLPIFNTERRTQVWFPSIKDISTEAFSPVKGSIEELASYCMKGCAQAPGGYAERDDLWAVFPK